MNGFIRTVATVLIIAASALAQEVVDENAVTNDAAPGPFDYEAARLTKVVRAVRINEAITIDGRLDEPAWASAHPATDFTQWSPDPGQPSPERAEVRFLYDSDNLYVGFHSWDSDMKRNTVTEIREDFSPSTSDVATLVIDSLHDRQSGYQFATNSAGAKRDSQITNDGQYNNDWDAVWDVKVTTQEDGWIAEFVIPFKSFRFSNAPTQEWGLNLGRKILRRNEDSQWAPIPVRYRGIGKVSLAGTLSGLEGLRPGRNLKVKPYFSAGVTQVRADGQMQTSQSLGRLKDYEGGVDVKYSLTPSLTLDATYRTDFAHVEFDQQQVNLTRFSLFFPEKREFFIENAGIFGFGSAGGGTTRTASGGSSSSASGNLSPFYSRRIGLGRDGSPIPILGGARVSGKAGRYDVGFIGMKTEDAWGTDAFGQAVVTTPSNNYFVGRVRRNLLTNSFIGALATSRDSTAAGDYNRVYGTDAYFEFDKLEFSSYILRSDTPGRSGNSQARKFGTVWRDDELLIGAAYDVVEANFNPEMGFLRRGNFTRYSSDFAWRPLLRNSATIRNLDFSAGLEYYQGENGKVETRSQALDVGILFQNNGSVNLNINQTFDRLTREFLIRSTERHHSADLPIVAGDYSYLSYTASFRTNQSRRIAGSGSFTWGEFWNGVRKSFSGALGVTPNYHLNVDLNYSHDRVTLPNGSFRTNLLGARFVYAFTSRAFLNGFIQYNADTRQVSSNIRFNIIHRPLSDLYIVYNDLRDTSNGQLVQRAFVVKLTNLFDF